VVGRDGGNELRSAFLEGLFCGITGWNVNLRPGSHPDASHAWLVSAEQKADLCAQPHRFHRSHSRNLVGPMFLSVRFGAVRFGAVRCGVLAGPTMSFEKATDPAVVLRTVIDSFAKFTRLQLMEKLTQKNIQCSAVKHNIRNGGREIVFGAVPDGADLAVSEELFTQSGSLDRQSILDFAGDVRSLSWSCGCRTRWPFLFLSAAADVPLDVRRGTQLRLRLRLRLRSST
jgi:hypothetical protein